MLAVAKLLLLRITHQNGGYLYSPKDTNNQQQQQQHHDVNCYRKQQQQPFGEKVSGRRRQLSYRV